ncbi:bHLH/Zip transcription factor [Cladophialophora chaetospira]|uniref:BHLH/Zip transcription factor n=1 Tax=Cladophialophora chaetospira TaxID=386627 RepID=A0AA38X4Y6_9EURO|nr:bHLH/Zip transcription factor [Cladophialophora chaetospira]
MTYYQESFFLDQFHDEAHFTGFHTDDDDQHSAAIRCFDLWSPSLEPQPQLDCASYAVRANSMDSSYVSPYLESLESPFAETAAALEVQSSSSSPLEYQSYQSPNDEQWAFFDSKPDAPAPAPTSSATSADINPSTTKATSPPRGRSTRSSTTNPHSKKGGRPRKKRHPSSSPSDSDSALRKAKHAHSVIERRYRDNLNGKMMQLHRVLSVVEAGQSLRSTGAVLDDSETKVSSKVRKSDIMTRAIGYIQKSEIQLKWLGEELVRLREQVGVCQGVGRGGERERFAGVQLQRQRQR